MVLILTHQLTPTKLNVLQETYLEGYSDNMFSISLTKLMKIRRDNRNEMIYRKLSRDNLYYYDDKDDVKFILMLS